MTLRVGVARYAIFGFTAGMAGLATARAQAPDTVLRGGAPACGTGTVGCVADRRPMGVHDIVTLREITDQRLAPDGRKVAFVVRQAVVRRNTYTYDLYVVDAAPGTRPRKLCREQSIGNVRWTPDGVAVTYLAQRGGVQVVLRIDSKGGKPIEMLARQALPPGIGAFEWSPTGDRLALVAAAPSSAARKNIERTGLIYTDRLSFRDLIGGSWLPTPARLWLYSSADKKLRKLWNAPSDITSMSWAPDGGRLAVGYLVSDAPEDWNNIDIGVVDVKSGVFTAVVARPGADLSPTFSLDGEWIAFTSQGDITGLPIDSNTNAIYVVPSLGGAARALGPPTSLSGARIAGWTALGEVVYERANRSTSAVFAIRASDGTSRSISRTTNYLGQCSLSALGTATSCVCQNTMVPPDIAIVDASTGSATTITDINPEFATLRVGEVTELTWSNKYHSETNGFLIRPIGGHPGRQYPFLVILYGFDGGFISQAQWITSYPAQAFASDGFAVLLMNYPRMRGWRYGDFAAASFDERDNPLASIEAAVDTVLAMGIADSTAIGIMGWSMGSFWTDLAITHAKRFRAASSGETGWRNPGTYWLGGRRWAYYQRSIFGGPPVGQWYDRYRAMSPSLSPPPLGTPVLREYESRSLDGLEYAMWLDQGAAMEIVFYPGEGHVFTQPVHRVASMQRNLDWFNFWLRGVKRLDSSAADQYTRWEQMRGRIRVASDSGSQTALPMP